MYDSGIPVTEFVTQLKKEIDVALPVPNSVYADSLNMLQSMIYSEIVRDQGIESYAFPENETEENIYILHPVPNNNNPNIMMFTLDIPQKHAGEDNVRFDDIAYIYANGVELIRTTPASVRVFPNSYARSLYDDKLAVIAIDERTYEAKPDSTETMPDDSVYLNVVFYRRPEVIRADGNTFSGGNVRLPREFIDLAKTKVRGDVYMTANEDALAAKWINEYNALLESFKMWVAAREPRFGMG